ncbi:hypothetical protein TSUD_330750 [Trifolium subterraneum]|nr:hypothetical protein TSUD_330750 [Trifolium subterraneum]
MPWTASKDSYDAAKGLLLLSPNANSINWGLLVCYESRFTFTNDDSSTTPFAYDFQELDLIKIEDKVNS